MDNVTVIRRKDHKGGSSVKRVRLFREVTGAYQFSGLDAKCLLAWLRSII